MSRRSICLNTVEEDVTMREVLDHQFTERAEIQLKRRENGVYEIIYNGVFLMASYNNHSEKILARTAIQNLPPKIGGYQILVGGLGMGFTVQEVLTCPAVSRVYVIEIEKAIIDWNRRYFSGLNGNVIQDPRIVLIQCDLFEFLYQTQARFDAVLIDVDNGPNWLALEKNKRLYSERTLRRINRCLKPNGILVTWSAQEAIGYGKKLNNVFHRTSEVRVKERVPKEGESLIYMAMNTS